MLPKEHGAWVALLVSLFTGWIVLDSFHPAAFAASLLWVSGFILRSPALTARQYWRTDPRRAKKAAAFFFFLLALFIGSAIVFFGGAPAPDIQLVLGAGIPLGLLISLIAAWRRNLRALWVEVLGFAALCLLAPAVILSDPKMELAGALQIYVLSAGYFILALFYVKVRQNWLARSRSGEKFTWVSRARSGMGTCLAHILFLIIVAAFAPFPFLVLGPLWAAARIGFGIFLGKPDLPIMKLGVREMIHSLVYFGITVVIWKFHFS